ncbi:hypothetical protein CA267_018005 [Alteromonas pelagimontana]|uniref:DUF3806 domain-containing protein n=1 Tax=Alteromonas pelagimontana TaxID=1858656 RepID=A0A6M4MHM5_9ALTE|nr:hypothetical protein [Alteromonas pelagimontana]QJR82512.1 hypothetical protein CA267_018005 [Alteromonas pelagimontana]
MQQADLEQLMAESANDAVQTAKQEFGVSLDFTPESIRQVDSVLLSFVDRYHDQALEDNAVFTLCNIFGAYVGESFKKIAGGNWRYDQTDPQAPFVVLDVGDRSYAFAGICYERLVNDSQISVKAYFDKASQNQMH